MRTGDLAKSARLAAVTAVVTAMTFLASCSPDSESPTWLPRTPSSGSAASIHLDFLPFDDLGDAAHSAGEVAIGTFGSRARRTTALELFPQDEMSKERPDLAGARVFYLWEFAIEESVAGKLDAGDTILVAIEEFADPELGYSDPARTSGQRSVLLTDPVLRKTSKGSVYFTVSPQPGYSFALVADDGTIVIDPESEAMLPADAEVPQPGKTKSGQDLAKAVASQLDS